MSSLKWKVVAYLGRTPDFKTEVKLQNDGGEDYIKEWNISSEKSKPTDSQLNALNSDATKLSNNEATKFTRKLAYGSIGDQLDLLYKDMLADKGDKTGEWFKAVKKVKDDNPKE